MRSSIILLLLVASALADNQETTKSITIKNGILVVTLTNRTMILNLIKLGESQSDTIFTCYLDKLIYITITFANPNVSAVN